MTPEQIIKEYKRRIVAGDDLMAASELYIEQTKRFSKDSIQYIKLSYWMQGNIFAGKHEVGQIVKTLARIEHKMVSK